MTELQSRLLEMFQWFHELCEKNNLRYYALGGTALGAVRHRGFIPWDDDIDVGMPRTDYERMEQILGREHSGRYVLETPNTTAKDYFYPLSKLYDTETTLTENTRLKIKRGIFIDIFPLDGIGDSEEEAKRNYRPIHWKHNLLLTRVTGIRAGRSRLKNAAVLVARFIPEQILDNKKLLLGLDRDCKKRDFDSNAWIGNLVGAWKYRELMPREVLGTPTLYEFEGKMMYGPQQADIYLTYLYGDWRKLPPKEKQVSHHDFILLDLHKSYLDEE